MSISVYIYTPINMYKQIPVGVSFTDRRRGLVKLGEYAKGLEQAASSASRWLEAAEERLNGASIRHAALRLSEEVCVCVCVCIYVYIYIYIYINIYIYI